MHDDKGHAHHPGKQKGRLPVWFLALGAVGLIALISAGIVAAGLLGGGALSHPPGDAAPAVEPERPALPVGR